MISGPHVERAAVKSKVSDKSRTKHLIQAVQASMSFPERLVLSLALQLVCVAVHGG